MNDDFASLPFDAFSPDQEAASPSPHLLDELALHGYRPLEDDPDPRPLPSSDAASFALEIRRRSARGPLYRHAPRGRSPRSLWSFVNLFHRKAERIGRDLDDNETAQRRSQAEQDGSEIRSVELERLIAQGLTLVERRNAFEFFRDNLASSIRPRPAPHGVRAPVRRSITAPLQLR